MIFKSRLTAPASKPLPDPTVNAEVEAVGEAADTNVAAVEEETRGEARALGSPVEEADTDVAAAEEEACEDARALGSPVEAADTDAAAEVKTCGEACAQGETLEEETCGEARTLGCPVEAVGTDVAAEQAPAT